MFLKNKRMLTDCITNNLIIKQVLYISVITLLYKFYYLESIRTFLAGPKVKTQARQNTQSEPNDENDGLLNKIKKAIFG